MCKYCKADYKNPEIYTNSEFEIDIDEDGLNIYANLGYHYEAQSGSVTIEINYCPMCGRNLKEEQHE